MPRPLVSLSLPADGLDLYRRMKAKEAKSPGSEFYYWIEDTLKCYLPREG